MFGRALKTNIVVSIAVLLLIGMLLIDFVLVRTTQQSMIQEKISKGYLVASLLEDIVATNFSNDPLFLVKRLKPRLADILSENDFMNISLMGSGRRIVYSADKGSVNRRELENLMRETLSSGERRVRLFDTTWGVFWYQRKTLIIAVPLTSGTTPMASIGVLMDLEPIYAGQRHAQRFVLFYLAINTLILVTVGFFRLSKIYLDPINRLVRMADDYQEADGVFFPVRKQDNELGKLSKALNMMLRRISEDKKKLRTTVDSLEKSNLELKKAQAEMIRAEKLASIGRLSSGIAHEIGNPIGIVTGYLDLLKQENIPLEEKTEFVERIENEIRRMDTVIRQLLDLSRPSVTSAEIISVHEIIRDMTHVLGVQPLTSNLHIDLKLNAAADCIEADSNLLRQVFLNLAINAADAIQAVGDGPVGRLTIQTQIEDGGIPAGNQRTPRLKIMFIDNGPGIPSEYLGNIFDPFFTTKDPGKGTGLGLSVCFMIVESLGGTISAESQPGGGANMSIWLPLAT